MPVFTEGPERRLVSGLMTAEEAHRVTFADIALRTLITQRERAFDLGQIEQWPETDADVEGSALSAIRDATESVDNAIRSLERLAEVPAPWAPGPAAL